MPHQVLDDINANPLAPKIEQMILAEKKILLLLVGFIICLVAFRFLFTDTIMKTNQTDITNYEQIILSFTLAEIILLSFYLIFCFCFLRFTLEPLKALAKRELGERSDVFFALFWSNIKFVFTTIMVMGVMCWPLILLGFALSFGLYFVFSLLYSNPQTAFWTVDISTIFIAYLFFKIILLEMFVVDWIKRFYEGKDGVSTAKLL